ncbi:MAG TPA: hypothetical protein VFY40_04150 [Blastocatellia bacterium]|nr:hypothetical protein [Blastocatellia bacterium]
MLKILCSKDTPWGDYGRMLMHGMTSHLPRTSEGLLQLERTAPFVPPITFPGISDLVVTDNFRQRLDSSGLTGLSFMPVKKARIVTLEWERWDRKAPKPAFYPESGEPEDYILSRRHNPKMAEVVGELWEIALTVGLRTQRPRPVVERMEEIEVLLSSWNGADLCRATGVGYVYASDRAQQFFLNEVCDYVAFRDCTVVD